MITEIQKRPFVRPLLFWICGILLYTFFPYKCTGMVLLIILILFLSILLFFNNRRRLTLQYDSRGTWGILFFFTLLLLAFMVTGYNSGRVSRKGKETGWFIGEASRLQQQITDSMDDLSLSDRDKSVLAALTIGYKKDISRETRTRFSITGVSHILAVSGFHVATVCGFLTFLFGFLPDIAFIRWLRYLMTISILWLFVFITGLAASTVRAGLMFTFYLTGKVIRRNPDSYNTLAAAAFCMLVYDPLYLFDIGFQLSYTAVFFILYLQPGFQGLIPVRNPLLAYPWGWLTVTLAAQIGTIPLCLYYFGQSSLVFLFVNLPVVFLATVLIPLALLWIVLPSGLTGLQTLVEQMTSSLLYIVDRFASLPGINYICRFDLLSLIIGYSVLFSGMLFFKYRRPWMLLVALLFVFSLLILHLIRRITA